MPPPQCRHGADNDGDGKVEYPVDLVYKRAGENTESPDPSPRLGEEENSKIRRMVAEGCGPSRRLSLGLYLNG